jgi:ATP-dependent exoDNAse (exonuclease V) beta subunit
VNRAATGSAPEHLALTASAGSGKTYQLTARMIGLMSLGVKPERILAITFTRKSAADIFTRLMVRLAGAAGDPDALKELNGSLPPWARPLAEGEVPMLLRRVIDAVPRLSIGTMDSFFYRIARAFCFELGLPPGVEVTEGYAADQALVDVMDRWFSPTRDPKDLDTLAGFIQRASFGAEGKAVHGQVRSLIMNHRDLYGRAPDVGVWGGLARIFPSPHPIMGSKESFEDADTQALLQALDARPQTGPQKEQWQKWLEAYTHHTPGLPIEKVLEGFIEKLIGVRTDLEGGSARIRVARKEQEVGAPAGRLLARLLRVFLRNEYAVHLERTRGLFSLLEGFEGLFDREVRAAGQLTFQDVPLRLARRAGGGSATGWNAADMEYRLDGGFDHWLIDEFQDTSTLQWAALSRLADEVLQDNTGRRSFFYVGDVKQSIYIWRQGDPRLFHLLQQHYSSVRAGAPLAMSWRSSPVVLDAVNAVFDPAGLRGVDRLPQAVVDRWAKDWSPHQAAPPVAKLPGYVARYEMPDGKDVGSDEKLRRKLEILAALVAAAPASSSRAVLVRGNEFGQQVVDALRNHGVRAMRDGTGTISDNPAVEGFLDLARFSACPGNGFFRRAVEMSGFGVWAAANGRTLDRLAQETLRDAAEDGWPGLVRLWRDRLSPAVGEAFIAARWVELLDSAREFEASIGGGPVAFEAYVRGREVGELPDPEAVRVLTIHRAKGLEFDTVFLPELNGRSFASSGAAGVTVQTAEDIHRAVEWIFDCPQRLLMEPDPVLSAHLAGRDADVAYENLCVFYVAMTRARRGLVLLNDKPSETSVALTPGQLSRRALANGEVACRFNGVDVVRCYAAGDEAWAAAPVKKKSVQPLPPAVPELRLPIARARLKRRLPSAATHGGLPVAGIFTGSAAGDFGTALHSLFEKVEWAVPGVEDAAVKLWREEAGRGPGADSAVESEFRGAMANAEFRAALTRPRDPVELWRERRFEMADEDRWISGCFDRVVIRRDPDGRAVAAEVLDFKSNEVRTEEQIAAAAESYRSQLDVYRSCLSRMLDLPIARIAARLLFTKPARGVALFEVSEA